MITTINKTISKAISGNSGVTTRFVSSTSSYAHRVKEICTSKRLLGCVGVAGGIGAAMYWYYSYSSCENDDTLGGGCLPLECLHDRFGNSLSGLFPNIQDDPVPDDEGNVELIDDVNIEPIGEIDLAQEEAWEQEVLDAFAAYVDPHDIIELADNGQLAVEVPVAEPIEIIVPAQINRVAYSGMTLDVEGVIEARHNRLGNADAITEYVRCVVDEAKLKFGTPEENNANRLAVRRFVCRVMEKHKLAVSQSARIVDRIVSAVFHTSGFEFNQLQHDTTFTIRLFKWRVEQMQRLRESGNSFAFTPTNILRMLASRAYGRYGRSA